MPCTVRQDPDQPGLITVELHCDWCQGIRLLAYSNDALSIHGSYTSHLQHIRDHVTSQEGWIWFPNDGQPTALVHDGLVVCPACQATRDEISEDVRGRIVLDPHVVAAVLLNPIRNATAALQQNRPAPALDDILSIGRTLVPVLQAQGDSTLATEFCTRYTRLLLAQAIIDRAPMVTPIILPEDSESRTSRTRYERLLDDDLV